VVEMRGFGLIGALELRRPAAGRFATVAPNALGAAAHALSREEGVVVRGIRDLVALAPPLVVTHDELDRMFAALARALDRLWTG
jgi:adenosylmethionine-8-amino-7-oxononanoate aminotransferase